MNGRPTLPFSWAGGKQMMTFLLLPLIPPHEEYVEPFFGSGALFFRKEPSRLETLNDIDRDIANFFRVLRDRLPEFLLLAELTLVSRSLYEECRRAYRHEDDPVRRAWMWWVVASQSTSGTFGRGWSRMKQAGRAGPPRRLASRIRSLAAVAGRLQGAQIEDKDALECMGEFCRPTSFCYVDPPYLHSSRRDTRLYVRETTLFGHDRLVRALLELPGHFLVSGVVHPIYAPLEDAGWTRLDFRRPDCATPRDRHTAHRDDGEDGAGWRNESLWVHPRTWEHARAGPLAELVAKCQRMGRSLSYMTGLRGDHHTTTTTDALRLPLEGAGDAPLPGDPSPGQRPERAGGPGLDP